MAYTYTTINGQRVEKNVAAAFQKLRAAFKKKFGLDLLVSSGTRTRAEQQRLRDLYLAGKGNLAAPPGYSNHEESGPRGPRALDVRDSGSDYGVTRKGTTRANWLKANAAKHGFNPAGYGFSQVEPWHIEFTGALAIPAGNVTGTPAVKYAKSHMTKVQRALITLGYDLAPHGADGVQGPITTAAVRAFQKKAGLTVDGMPGPRTLTALEAAVAKLTKPADPQPDPEPPVSVPSPVEPDPVDPVEPSPVEPPDEEPPVVVPPDDEPEVPVEKPLPNFGRGRILAGSGFAFGAIILAIILNSCGGPAL